MGKVTGNWGVDKRTSERVSDHDLHYEVWLWVKLPVIGEWTNARRNGFLTTTCTTRFGCG